MSTNKRRVLIIDPKVKSYKCIDFELTSLMPISLLLTNYLATNDDLDTVVKRDFIVIGTGVLGGHAGVGLAVSTLTGISPQSNRVIEAKIEGKLAASIRSLGLDALAIDGCSDSMIGLKISSQNNQLVVKFEDAELLRGKSVWQTTKSLEKDNQTVLAIGKAGEEKVPSASVVCDYGFPTQTGGVGAIFGRLQIKYIAIQYGIFLTPGTMTRQISLEYLDGIKAGNILSKFHFDPPGFGVFVSPTLSGYLGGGNFATKLPSETEQFNPQDYIDRLAPNQEASCPGCIQNCLKVIGSTPGESPDGFRVHQLGITVFASQWADSDPDRALRFNSYCHEIGVEHLYISALLLQEEPRRDISVEELVDRVYEKNLNADALAVKNMPLPPFDPRGNQALGVAMALNPTGPRYDVIEHDIDFDPHWSWVRHSIFGQEFGIPEGGLPVATLDARRHQPIAEIWKLWSALDALGVCIFASPPTRDLRLSHIYAMTLEITGQSLNRELLFELGLSRLSLLRRLNGLLGLKSDEDDLPEYFFKNPISAESMESDGPIFGNEDVSGIKQSKLYFANLSRNEFDAAKSFIYREFGWDRNGSVVDNHPITTKSLTLQKQFNKIINDKNYS